MILTADITGTGVLVALLGFVLVWFLIDLHHERTPLFQTFPAPAPKLAPLPGEAPAGRYITASDLLPGLVAALTPPPAPMPDYVAEQFRGHPTVDALVDSIEMRAIRDGAL